MRRTTFKTEQEAFWAGSFGDDYVSRNADAHLLASNIALFSEILNRTGRVRSVVEFGANIGLNLMALRQLLPDVFLEAIEINRKAASSLRRWGCCEVHECSIVEYVVKRQFDLSFTKGVLIHIAPESLPQVYDLLFSSSRRYIVIAEYYNPMPIKVTYRGHQGKLFKRDFAGEFMDRFPTVALVDYKFVYHRSSSFPQDDLTWFLFEKNG